MGDSTYSTVDLTQGQKSPFFIIIEFQMVQFKVIIYVLLGAPDCGGIYTGESGEIVSPGYHFGAYRPNMICDWEIRLPDTNSIRIKWLNFDVERSRNCMFDSVQV